MTRSEHDRDLAQRCRDLARTSKRSQANHYLLQLASQIEGEAMAADARAAAASGTVTD